MYHEYRSELLFFAVLSVAVVLSHWLSHYIPEEFYDVVLMPMQNACTATVCMLCAWLMLRHNAGLPTRKYWGSALLIWGITESLLLIIQCVFQIPILLVGSDGLSAFELLVGNTLGWILLLYPTQALRPGWMNFRRGVTQLLPMYVCVGLNYLLPVDLSPLIALYPFVLAGLLVAHIRAYRIWCEENYSSMEDIDVQWIMRYLIMLMLVGASYFYMYVSTNPARSFTQQWLLLFLFGYSTEQILFRREVWTDEHQSREEDENGNLDVDGNLNENKDKAQKEIEEERKLKERAQLELWMEQEKPYLNPDFRLMDISAILPMNRTYLSQLINSEYGCTFYHFVTNYRIEEAKRLIREYPDMKLQDVAEQSGFSSRVVFSRIFTKEVGLTPKGWAKAANSPA